LKNVLPFWVVRGSTPVVTMRSGSIQNSADGTHQSMASQKASDSAEDGDTN